MLGENVKPWFQLRPDKSLQPKTETACGPRARFATEIHTRIFCPYLRKALETTFRLLKILRSQPFLGTVSSGRRTWPKKRILDVYRHQDFLELALCPRLSDFAQTFEFGPALEQMSPFIQKFPTQRTRQTKATVIGRAAPGSHQTSPRAN